MVHLSSEVDWQTSPLMSFMSYDGMTLKANQVLGVSGLSRSGRQETPLRRRSCYVIETAAQPALMKIHFAGLAA